MARLGLTPAQFFELTPIEFNHAIQEKNTMETMEAQAKYEVARYQLLHLWNMQGKRLRRSIKSFKEVNLFPWEEGGKEPVKAQSLASMKRQLRAIDRHFNGKKKRRA